MPALEQSVRGAEPEQAPQGQILDLETGANDCLRDVESLEVVIRDMPEVQELTGVDPEVETESSVVERLRDSLLTAVVEGVLAQHQLRVAVHKAFEAAFRRILEKGRGAMSSAYPVVVAAATKRFAAISIQVRAAATVLSHRGADAREVANIVKRLQVLEKNKLALMAASHLDRVRLMARRIGPDPGPGLAAEDAAVTRRRIGTVNADIEETVSELRHALVELREEQASMEE